MTDSEVEQVDVLLAELERIAQHHSLVGADGRASTELKRFYNSARGYRDLAATVNRCTHRSETRGL